MDMLLVGLLLAGQAAGPSQPVAMVVQVEGTVKLHSAKKDPPRDARVMDLLYAGQRLAASEDGRVTLVFRRSGHREQLKNSAEATVGEDGCQPAAAVQRLKAPAKAKALQPGLDELKRGGRGAVSVFRGPIEDKPPAVSPMLGATVVTDRPTLAWPAVEKAKAYHVELLVSGSKRVIWKGKTTEPRLPFPAKEPLNRGRKYEWRVMAEVAEDMLQQVVSSEFSLCTAAEARQLDDVRPFAESADPADLMLAAATYHAYGIYGEALTLFERLTKLAPKEPAYHAARAAYYERAGRTEDAKKAWEQAKAAGFVWPSDEEQKP